jgi:hypothetical protein
VPPEIAPTYTTGRYFTAFQLTKSAVTESRAESQNIQFDRREVIGQPVEASA